MASAESGIFPAAKAKSRRADGLSHRGVAVVAFGRRQWRADPFRRARAERRVRRAYEPALSRAGFVARLVIEWEIRRAVRAILARHAPSPDALFAASTKRRTGRARRR